MHLCAYAALNFQGVFQPLIKLQRGVGSAVVRTTGGEYAQQ